MENAYQNTPQTNTITNTHPNSQQMISKIMYYIPPTYQTVNGHGQPLIDKFNVDYLTNILDRNKIQSIDKVYKSKEDGFNLLEFVRFFLNVIDHEEIETLYLTIALIDFFKEISQCSGFKDRLHFIDITNYICNKILQKRNEQNHIQSNFIPDYRTIQPNFKVKQYLLNPPKIYASKDQLVYKLSHNKIQIDKTKHQGVVTSCCFSENLMKVFTLDDLSDSISVYNTNCCLVKKIKPNYFKLKKDIVVLSFAYSERQERIGAVLKDFSINFWDNSDNFQFQKSISIASHCPQYQTNIWFFEYFNSWVTSGKNGYLYVWNLETEQPQRTIKLAFETQVNDLAVIPCINLIAVVQQRRIYIDTMNGGSHKRKAMDQNTVYANKSESEYPIIYLYDFFKGEIMTKIQLGTQNRNPHTLQYSETYQVLLSAGYQKKINLFQINKTFLDTNKKGQLTGHQSLITSFTLLKKSPMVVSADDKGKVKVWDIRSLKCVQTVDFRDKTNITKLLDMIDLGKIGVLGSRINFVEFDEKTQIQKRLNNKDKVVPLWIQCDYSSQQIIVLTKKDLRVLDMRKGIVKNIYCQFHTQEIEITFFKYFQSLKKIVIGNQKGQVRIYCIRTGKLQGRLIDHQGSIVHVQYDQQNKIFITMGQDSTIQIQKQILGQYQQKDDYDTTTTNKKSEIPKNKKYSPNHSKDQNQKNMAKSNNNTIKKQKNTFISNNINRLDTLNINKNNPNFILLRQIKNNQKGRQLTLSTVSIYHGFLALASSQKCIYIWDYQYSKLLMIIKLPQDLDIHVDITSLAFINGYSILMIGTSDGLVYFVKISKVEQSYRIKTIGIFKSLKNEPVISIIPDLLIKGFSISQQKFVYCKVYFGYASGTVTSLNLSKMISLLKQQSSAVHKQTFNAERQLRQNFTTQIQKKKYQTYQIQKNLDDPIFGQINAKNQNPDVCTIQAHKNGLTGLSIVQLDQCYLMSIGHDQKLKIWKQNQLICDWNINLPLPYKWQIKVNNQHKKRDKIMFALKIIQQIFLKYGNDISINQSKALKVRKLLDKVRIQTNEDQTNNFITQPRPKIISKDQKHSVTLFQNQFSKKDMHYDYMKKFNFCQIAGPTLREIQVQRKLNNMQKQWATNTQKIQQQNNKLLATIRIKAQKNQQKQQVLQFLQPRNYNFSKTKDKQKQNKQNQLNNSPFVKNIIGKIDNIISPPIIKKQTFINQSATLGFGHKSKDKGFMSLQKSKTSVFMHKPLKFISSTINQKKFDQIKQIKQIKQKQNKPLIQTFEKYFQQKQTTFFKSKNYNTQNSWRTTQSNPNLSKTMNNFRNILTRMNDRVKQSKQKKIKSDSIDDNQPNFRSMTIATSDGKRSCLRRAL